MESALAEWRRLLRGSVIEARAVIDRTISERIVMMPRIVDLKPAGYEFRTKTRFDQLFKGWTPPPFLKESSNRGYEHITPADTGDESEGNYSLEPVVTHREK